MLSFILVASLIALGSSLPEAEIEREWTSFKMAHNKNYKDEVAEVYRKSVFRANYKKITEFNNKGSHSYTLGINEFSDMTSEEFFRQYTMKANVLDDLPEMKRTSAEELYGPLNHTQGDSLDYRQYGFVTPVKNQGQCASCWAFGVMASLEGVWAKNKGQLNRLSEQDLVDCFGGNCNANYPRRAAQFLIDRGSGALLDACYPYVSGDLAKANVCHTVASNCIAAIPRQVIVPKNEADIKLHLEQAGPIAVVHATTHDWQHYSGGIFDDPFCQENMDPNVHGSHVTTIIGYGVEGGKAYWLIKNSWGTTFGEAGYIRMARGNNQCGLADWPQYSTV